MADDKVALDAATDQAVMILRDHLRLTPDQEAWVEGMAGVLAVQFGHVPELGRILVAAGQGLSPFAGVCCGEVAAVLAILSRTGERLASREAPDA